MADADIEVDDNVDPSDEDNLEPAPEPGPTVSPPNLTDPEKLALINQMFDPFGTDLSATFRSYRGLYTHVPASILARTGEAKAYQGPKSTFFRTIHSHDVSGFLQIDRHDQFLLLFRHPAQTRSQRGRAGHSWAEARTAWENLGGRIPGSTRNAAGTRKHEQDWLQQRWLALRRTFLPTEESEAYVAVQVARLDARAEKERKDRERTLIALSEAYANELPGACIATGEVGERVVLNETTLALSRAYNDEAPAGVAAQPAVEDDTVDDAMDVDPPNENTESVENTSDDNAANNILEQPARFSFPMNCIYPWFRRW